MGKRLSTLGAVRLGPVKANAADRADDIFNAIEGLGELGRDSTKADRFVRRHLSWHEIENIYRGSHTAARVCDVFPEHMFQEGWELIVPGEEESSMGADVKDFLSEAGCDDETLATGFSWGNAYGGAGLILGADDGQSDWSQPLNEDAITTFDWANLAQPVELRVLALYPDVLAKKFGQPMIYQLHPDVAGSQLAPNFMVQTTAQLGAALGQRTPPAIAFERLRGSGFLNIHESRIVRFDGVRLPRRQMLSSSFPGWGDSLLERAWEHVERFDAVYQYGARLMRRFQAQIMKLVGLAEISRGDPSLAAAVIMQRAKAAAYSQNIANTLIMDENEQFEIAVGSLAGYADMLDRYTKRVASVGDVPVTIFLGESPAGLNATGNNDVMTFFTRVKSRQRLKVKPKIERLVHLAFVSKEGPTKGIEPKNWEIRFPSLYKLSPTEESTRNFQQAEADEKYVVNQILTPDEIAQSRFPITGFSLETKLDKKTRAKLKPLVDKALMQEAKTAANPPPEPVPGAPTPAKGQTPPPKPKGG